MSPIDKLILAVSEHILNPLFFLAFAVAICWFLYGGFMYIWQDAPEAKSSGRERMFWGIVGLLVMLSAFTIIQIIANTIGEPVPSL